MNTLGKILCSATAAGLLLTSAYAEDVVDFGKFKPATGAEFVEVNIQSNLIDMVVNLAKNSEPEIAEALQGLKAVRVNVVGLNDENAAEMKQKIDDIRAQLNGNGWERIVTALQDKQDVGVFIKMKGSEAVEGVVVTVIHAGKQAVLVKIVGDIRPEKIATVGERFNIEPLKHLGVKTAAK